MLVEKLSIQMKNHLIGISFGVEIGLVMIKDLQMKIILKFLKMKYMNYDVVCSMKLSFLQNLILNRIQNLNYT